MRWGLRGVCGLVALLAPLPAVAGCVGITTPQQLNAVRNNLNGSYCLKTDLDMKGIANFRPIGDFANPFTGKFDGVGHTIVNLTIKANTPGVGLFGAVDGGDIRRLRLAGVAVDSKTDDALVGGLVGLLISGQISDVSVGGALNCTGEICRIGGVVGQSFSGGLIKSSSSSANVTGRNGGAAGGLTGQNNGRLTDVYATGRITCRNNCAAGGLSGQSEGAILRAFASGPVSANRDGAAGGLIGVGHGALTDAYATGAVSVLRQSVAGLVAWSGGRTKRVFAAGRVTFGSGSSAGGLVESFASSDPVTEAYWDSQTTTLLTSAAGTSQTTDQLRSALPAGFGNAWSITGMLSYPFLTSEQIDFRSTLATLVRQHLIFTFLPISQLEQPEYARAAPNRSRASLAAVYGMLARAAGTTWDDDRLIDVPLDTYFWKDSTQTATWKGPVQSYVSLGPLKNIAAATALSDSNVVGALRAGNLAIVRGTYSDNGTSREHWVLATLFTGNGGTLRVIANDPRTGKQVEIDPSSKHVVSPAGFPLTNFTVNGYQVVRLQ